MNQSTPHNTYSLLFALLDSVLTPRSAIYVAGPLDTGRAYYEALGCGTVDASVRAKNEAALSSFVNRLRLLHHPTPAIDPGLLRVPEWSPREIGDFFLQTISRYAKEAWFIDGWEYSSGATKEFLHCKSLGIPCCDENGQQIDADRAIRLLSSAIVEITRLGAASPKLEERLVAFQSVLNG